MDDTVVLEQLFRDGDDFYRIQIREDPFPTSPREYDNTGLLLTWESRYASPDGRDGATPALDRALGKWKVSNDFLRPVAAATIIRYLRAFARDEIYAAAALSRSADGLELLLDFNPAPGGWYDGLALVPAERWKASMGGTPPETGLDVDTAGGPRHVPSAKEALVQDVEIYNAYLRGEVYEYALERAVLGGWEHIDSCSDMMGDVEQYVFAEARAELPDSAVEIEAMPERRQLSEEQQRYAQDVRGILLIFEYELCEECGQDLDRHAISPDPLGRAHAFCLNGEVPA